MIAGMNVLGRCTHSRVTFKFCKEVCKKFLFLYLWERKALKVRILVRVVAVGGRSDNRQRQVGKLIVLEAIAHNKKHL